MTDPNEKFIVYWLGYHSNPPAIQSLPDGIDVVNLFLLNLANSDNGTTLDTTYITSSGTSWDDILSQAHAAQDNGVKVCASLMPPNAQLIWNTIPDPDVFAKNVYDLVTQWGLDGIDIDPEQGNGVPPDARFVSVVEALSQYFGPASDTGLTMTFPSYILSLDRTVLEPCASLLDYVMLMGYGWSYDDMISEFDQYAEVVGPQKVMFGIGGDPWQTTTAIQPLAEWEPTGATKGGMMEFNIQGDTNYAAANAIIQALGS